MKKGDRRTVLAIVGVILIVAVFTWLGFSGFNDSIHSVPILEQGDTRIQQEIRLGTYSKDNKYYICTYVEVYNWNEWVEAERWHDYATADQIVYVKEMQRELAEKARVEIGKAIREFYYGEGN